ncbi:MAG: hypothetical protein FWH22_08745 [Fibromonadales bacterium]|nr:hypothetical protein [Fibromonadales bacterium]
MSHVPSNEALNTASPISQAFKSAFITLLIALLFGTELLAEDLSDKELNERLQKVQKEVTNPETAQSIFLPKDTATTTYKRGDPIENISEEDLFLQIFGIGMPSRLRNFMVKFYADNRFFGDVEVMYDAGFTAFEFFSKRFYDYLDTLLLPDINEKINAKNGMFNSKELESLQFTININESKYELRINVPPEHKALQRMSLRSQSTPKGEQIEPAFFSFYLNAKATDNFQYRQYLYEKDYDKNELKNNYERMPATLDLDGAAAFKGFVLEGSGYVREPREGQSFDKNHFRRNDFRLIKDLYSRDARLSLGDVGANTGGLMRYETMGGIRYEYDKTLFSGSNIDMFNDLYKINFFLPKTSQVEIRINHRTVRRLHLPAGYHEINGLSGVEGTNLVEIYVTKEDGSLERIPYEFLLGNSRNLLKGEFRYSATAGVRRSSVPMGYEYHASNPGISSDLLYGLLPALSLGVSGQASQNNLMAGGQALWSINKANWMEFKNLFNYEDSSGGMRSELRYLYRTKPVSYSITTYYQSEEYNPNLFRSLSGPATNYAGLSASASTRFFKGSISANTGLSLNKETEHTAPVSKRYGVSLSQNIFRISLSANFNASKDKNGWQPYASMGAGYSFGVNRHNFAITNTTAMNSIPPDYDEYEWKNRSNLNWNWSNGGSGTGARSYSAGVSAEDFDIDNASLRLGARHSYNRANLSAAYNLYNYDYDYMTRLTHTVKADMGASFMFADGLWAFGRPVSRGFILASTGKSLQGSTLHINYSDYHKTSFSENGWLGAAYYNQISNYRSNEMRISLTDAPMGAWLEQNRYYAMGAYKQGYAIRLGSEANVLLHLTLLKEDGPLSYTYLIIDNRPTFTGRDGALLVGNLKPGQKYIIHFGENSPMIDMEIYIPEDAGNFVELPDMKVEYRQ